MVNNRKKREERRERKNWIKVNFEKSGKEVPFIEKRQFEIIWLKINQFKKMNDSKRRVGIAQLGNYTKVHRAIFIFHVLLV